MSEARGVLGRKLGPSARDVPRLVLLRAVLQVLGFAATVGIASVIVQDYGFESYGVVALISSLPLLIPFADFGLGASVVNAAADAQGSDNAQNLHATLRRVQRMLVVVGIGATAAALCVALWGGWNSILGVPSSSVVAVPLAATAVVAVYGATLYFSQGTRLLQGVGRIATATTINASVPIGAFGIVLASHYLSPSAVVYAIAPSVASLIANVIGLGIARRDLVRRFGPARQVAAPPSVWFLVSWGVAGMLTAASVALMTQGSRVVVAHRGSADELADFSAAWLPYAGAVALAAIYGQYLWPRWRSVEPGLGLTSANLKRELVFGAALGVFNACIFAVVTPAVFIVVTGVLPAGTLVFAGAAAVFVQTVHQPSAMALMDRRGLLRQARLIAPVAVLVLVTTAIMTPMVGAAAGFFAIAAWMGIVQVPVTVSWALARARPEEHS